MAAALVLAAPFATQQAAAQDVFVAMRKFDITKYPQARRLVLNASGFPNLREFEVMDPYTGDRYNCIAHSLGVHSRWVNPRTGPAGKTLQFMDAMYKEKGYTRVTGTGTLDFRLTAGIGKVVVYATVQSGKIQNVTHAALQEPDGSWSSKLGQLPLIRHPTPQALNGSVYGQPVAVYVRRR